MCKKKPNYTGPALAGRIISVLILLGIILFIFSNSYKPGAASGAASQTVTAWLNRLLSGAGQPFTINEHFVRKAGHFAEFALLGLWMICTLRIHRHKIMRHMAWPLFLSLLVAVLDEFLQLFIPGRSGQVSDVVLDFTGAVSGMLLAGALMAAAQGLAHLRTRRKKQR